MSLDYVTGVGIPFETNATQVLGGISRATKALRTDIAALQKQVADLDAALLGVGNAAKATAADVSGLGAAMRAQSVAAGQSARSANAAADGYANVGRAAASAAANVARLNVALALTGGSAASRAFTATAATAATAFVPPAVQRPAALAVQAAEQAMLPAATMRRVGAQNATGQVVAAEGWVSPYFAGAVGGGGGNDEFRGSNAYGRGRGPGGPVFYGGGGGRGPGGPGGGGPHGGAGEGPFGGFGDVAFGGALAHRAFGAAKIGAFAVAGYAGDAVYEAGKLQRELTLIQTATGASHSQVEAIRQAAYNISNMTAQSVAQSAGVIGVMASSGINDPKALLARGKGGATFAETVAKFADVQYLKSGGQVSFAEATKQAIQLAHLYRSYKPDEISPVLDQVSKLSFMMPDSLNRYLTQAGYYVPLLSRLGVPREQSLTLGAFLDRMGLGRGKGGTAIQNFTTALMKPLMVTGHQQRGQLNALEALGIYDRHGNASPHVFKTGPGGHSVIDIFGALQQINSSIDEQTKNLKGDAKARKERELVGDFQKAFGIQGQRFGLLGDDKGLEQLLGMVRQVRTMPDVQTAQSRFMQNFDAQAVRAWSNFQSLATEVGTQALPGLTKGLLDTGDALHEAQVWLHKHGDLEIGIQHSITSAVSGTEQYITSHHKDWDALAGDLKGVADAAVKAGPDIKHVGDAFFGLIANARSLGLALDKANAASQNAGRATNAVLKRGVQALTGLTPEQQDAINKQLSGVVGPVMNYNFDRAPGDLYNLLSPQAKSAPSEPGPRRQHTRSVVHHHHGDIIVQGAHDPEATARVVKRVLDDARGGLARAAQHRLGRSGSSVTSAVLPNALTVRH